MCNMELDVVAPIKPIFYKRYVDESYVKRKQNSKNELFEKLNTYHDNIKLKIEENQTNFLDTETVRHNSSVIINVNRRPTKVPVYWSSKILSRYRRNAIN